jgi:hypothetical protein
MKQKITKGWGVYSSKIIENAETITIESGR